MKSRYKLTDCSEMLGSTVLAAMLGMGCANDLSSRYQSTATIHAAKAKELDGKCLTSQGVNKYKYNEIMIIKYKRAARFLSLVVSPDPPEPE